MEKHNAVYLTPAELSARWKGKPKVGTLQNWRSRGLGPKFHRFGNSVLYLESEIEAYEREQERKPGAQAAG